ncbi:hypothetical protein LJE71_17955 [Xanthobacter autotrophicus]|uniref:hypothetical protein n=1 Tax=Xanthobacter autotrophicus TaxID=280 RepID=UPI001E31D163|nr:hypothetical protein [Xanthobacter autotrophicus]UDQ88149.1 hypothetical protein LJE71_17955 [Xanthobacter autotrophicus]
MVESPDPAGTAEAAADAPVGSRNGGSGRDGRRSSGLGKAGKLTARLVGLVIAIGAVIWLWNSVGILRLDSGLFLRPVASRMMAGEPFDPDIVVAMDADMSVVLSDRVCDYRALQDLAIVRSALAEIAFQGDDADLADKRLAAAEQAAKASIVCSPGSPRAWTVLAWIEHIRHEDTPLLRAFLRKSFRSGPYEGWAMVRRLEILLALYPKLDESEMADLKQSVNWLAIKGMAEYIGEQYVSAKLESRVALRNILADTPERAQKRAAEVIRNGGEDIDLPAVEPLGSRPWK